MQIKIYQINTHRDTKRVKFFSSETLAKDGIGLMELNRDIYDLIWSGETPALNLESVFEQFQHGIGNTPADFTGHSLSVSDVVEVVHVGAGYAKRGLYFCDSVGFKPCAWESAKPKMIADRIEDVKSIMCDQFCKWPDLCKEDPDNFQDLLAKRCAVCPLVYL